MAKYLINEREADALRKLVKEGQPSQNLGWDTKRQRPIGNFPFNFKLKESMGATTANKANAAIWFLGDSTGSVIESDYVVDQSSQYAKATSGYKGVCFASSAYHIGWIYEYSTANEYMGLASTSYVATTTTITIDNLQPMDGIGTTLTTLSVFNKFAWAIIDNGECYAKWNKYSSKYELIQTRCT